MAGDIRTCKPIFFGMAGPRLSDEERVFFKEQKPLGFILFARNCETKEQVRELTKSLREVSGRDDVFILIDQEGGRVARLKPPHWRKTPPAGVFAELAQHNEHDAKEAVNLNARMIAAELHDLGITVNCAPMADVQAPGSHDIIGDRAYGQTPQQVATLAREMADGLLQGGVLPVLKHIPGHGRSHVDSHEDLPVVDASLDELRNTDFVPFKALKDVPLGMTAHILYNAIDPKEVATLSPTAITLMREELGFDGLLMSDDISMKALKGDLGTLSKKTLAAGCDVVLHCNGKMKEMKEVAEACPTIGAEAVRRANHALSLLGPPLPLNALSSGERLKSLLGTANTLSA